MEKKPESLIIQQPVGYTGTGLSGEVKNVTGVVAPQFIKAIERLMIKHKVNYIQLYWTRFRG